MATLSAHNQTLTVTRQGATLLSWDPGCGYSVADGCVSEAELGPADGYRHSVLAPWCNRIRNARWTDGVSIYDVEDSSGREGLHGVVFDKRFEEKADEDSLQYTIRAEAGEAYPVPFRLDVRYRITGPKILGIELEITNEGDRSAPAGLGLHPYFHVASLDLASVTVMGDRRILVDDELIPLPGNAPFTEYTQTPFEADHDYAVTNLWEENGWAHAELETGLEANIRVSMLITDHPLANFHIYSGGMLKRGTNKSVAVEPCTVWADVFNRPELAERIGLEPGSSRTLTVQYEAIF